MAEDPERPGAEHWLPRSTEIDELRSAASECRGCELWKDATQVVFSEGSSSARIMLVGEQPGDREDLAGEPFVGPAGRVLADALEAARIDRTETYITNAVKHFRFEPRGKRRIHQKPGVAHIVACHPWLDAEIREVKPEIIVGMGATAARSLFGRSVTIGDARGHVIEEPERLLAPVVVTVHPSSILRVRDSSAREAAFDAFVADLRVAARGPRA
ncbi:UdgX family uracil-DNA binding protein [Microbacterium sp. CIAB417]|uniref:UdgX family uracil-DNA binding protein n=1 Tax=Microbacterium sp. CIAB417 TaxID=2860287 RepID=UPI001FAD0F64|nr:UdgX family uracil-DNA binding protein [Microbacterium sp. CIAB417]